MPIAHKIAFDVVAGNWLSAPPYSVTLSLASRLLLPSLFSIIFALLLVLS